MNEVIYDERLTLKQFKNTYPNYTGKLIVNPHDEYCIGLHYHVGTFYYKDGELHREDGPAVESADGGKEWYQKGKRHREDGPAIEYADGDKSWWIRRDELSEEEYKQWQRKHKLEKFLEDEI